MASVRPLADSELDQTASGRWSPFRNKDHAQVSDDEDADPSTAGGQRAGAAFEDDDDNGPLIDDDDMLTPASHQYGEGDEDDEDDDDDGDEDGEDEALLAREGSGAAALSKKGCFKIMHKPYVVLFMTCILALCNYYDRGAFSGLVGSIQDEFSLDDTEIGLISAAFTVGYAFSSPVMAQTARYVPSGMLLMAGMIVWVVAAGACAFATDFWYLMVARCFTGIGEAAFVCLAPALIDDVAPPAQRGKWLAVFYSMLPIGYALGYLGAGLFISSIGWRWVFFTEVLVALPFVCLAIYLPNVKYDSSQGHSHGALPDAQSTPAAVPEGVVPAADANKPKSLLQALHVLIFNSTYVLMTLGYCAQTFVLGALTFWLPSYVNEVYELDEATANYIIGAITAFCGIVGNILAAVVMDYLVIHKKLDRTQVGVNLAVLFSWIGTPLAIAAVFMPNIAAFLVLMTAAEFFILCTVTPVNAVFLSTVSDDMRGHSVAMSTMAIHIFGDMWSPYVYGSISDATGSHQYALLFMAAWLGWVLLFWTIGAVLIHRQHQRRNVFFRI